MSCCASVLATKFDASIAAGDLDRYHRKGPNPTTRLLRDSIRATLVRGTLLDIGAGIGALSFELLDSGVATAVTAVDASPAYAAAARREAQARAVTNRVQYLDSDFVAVADTVQEADVVALDRVVCCYPAYRPLLEHAVHHARRVIAYSFPRDRWYIRMAVGVQNLLRALFGQPFRTHVHPERAMELLIAAGGFERRTRCGTLVWCVDVYTRIEQQR